jgi:hypothetical protein
LPSRKNVMRHEHKHQFRPIFLKYR